MQKCKRRAGLFTEFHAHTVRIGAIHHPGVHLTNRHQGVPMRNTAVLLDQARSVLDARRPKTQMR
jgi:hypothetical protein